MALTNTRINNAKPGDKPYKLSDGGGLHILIMIPYEQAYAVGTGMLINKLMNSKQ